MIKVLDTYFGPLAAIESDIRISQELVQKGHWEFQELCEILDVYEKYGAQPGIMLDVGCNIGTWLLPMARRYTQNQILAYDCQALAVECVTQTLKINRIPNVQVSCCAISDCCELRTVNQIDYTWGANFGAYEFELPGRNSDFNGKTLQQSLQVQTCTIDSFALDNVRFIKIDVEGMEYKVLQGATKTIQRCRPFVVFEHHKIDRQAAEQFCKDLGYCVVNTVGQMTMVRPL